MTIYKTNANGRFTYKAQVTHPRHGFYQIILSVFTKKNEWVVCRIANATNLRNAKKIANWVIDNPSDPRTYVALK